MLRSVSYRANGATTRLLGDALSPARSAGIESFHRTSSCAEYARLDLLERRRG